MAARSCSWWSWRLGTQKDLLSKDSKVVELLFSVVPGQWSRVPPTGAHIHCKHAVCGVANKIKNKYSWKMWFQNKSHIKKVVEIENMSWLKNRFSILCRHCKKFLVWTVTKVKNNKFPKVVRCSKILYQHKAAIHFYPLKLQLFS